MEAQKMTVSNPGPDRLRKVILIIALIFCAMSSGAQEPFQDNRLLMTHNQNQAWLASVKALPERDRWNIVADRFFGPHRDDQEKDDTALVFPLLVIDGVPLMITDSMSGDVRSHLVSLLKVNKIGSVQIIDKEPEGLYINKAFTGMILVTLADKKTGRKLKRYHRSRKWN